MKRARSCRGDARYTVRMPNVPALIGRALMRCSSALLDVTNGYALSVLNIYDHIPVFIIHMEVNTMFCVIAVLNMPICKPCQHALRFDSCNARIDLTME